MTRLLCVGQPPEWWETGDGGNRLALAICRACPNPPAACLEGDPKPHGVIRAGNAYSDIGNKLTICQCGYPNLRHNSGPSQGCERCTPSLDSFRLTIIGWLAAGAGYSTVARRLGFHKTSVRDACKRWGVERNASITKKGA